VRVQAAEPAQLASTGGMVSAGIPVSYQPGAPMAPRATARGNGLRQEIMPHMWSSRRPETEDEMNVWEKAQRKQLANPDTAWFVYLLRLFWPRIIAFVAAKIKQGVEDIHATIERPVSPSFYVELEAFTKRMSQHAVSMPLEKSWINTVLKDIWALVVPVFNQAIQTVLLPIINQKIPGIMGEVKVDPCTLGDTAPVVKRLVARPAFSAIKRPRELSSIVVELEWESELDICIKAGLISFGLRKIGFGMQLHISLLECLKKPPFVGGVGVWMDKAPEFDVTWSGSLEFLDMFNKLFHDKVYSVLSNVMILPNRIAIPIQTDVVHSQVDLLRIKRPWARGMLKISKIKATGLSRGSSQSPYMEVHLGCSAHRTSTIGKVHEGVEWTDDLYFLVDEPLEQLFSFRIHDKNGDPLADSQHQCLNVLGLLAEPGEDETAHHRLTKEVVQTKELEMDVMWGGMTLREHEERQRAIESGDVDADGGKQGKKRAGFFPNFKLKLAQHEIEHMKTVKTRLQFEVTWRPLELNAFVAKSIDPTLSNNPSNAPVAAVLFVGIHRCVHLPQDEKFPEKTVYWVQMRCSPCIDSLGKRFPDPSAQGKGAKKDEDEDGSAKSPHHKETAQEHKQHLKDEQKKDKEAEKASAGTLQCTHFQRTSKMKRPKRKDTNQVLAEDEDRQEELVKKICLLVKYNTPFNVIADTLDISPATVQQFIFNAALGSLAEHCDIEVKEGFFFLLDNPRKAKVHLGVFRSVNSGSPELLGEMDYSVGQLLGTSLLSQDLEGVPLVGDHPGAKISARFQLRTVFMGDGGRPLGAEKQPGSGGGAGGDRGAQMGAGGAAVPVVFVPGGAPQPQRVSFLDRVGREKVQVDGIWQDSDEERG